MNHKYQYDNSTMSKAPKTPRKPDPLTRRTSNNSKDRRINEGLLASPTPITPIKTKKQQQQNNRIRPKNFKTVYLIRHGESLGQVSQQTRKTDESLLDCGLTAKGISQAQHIPKLFKNKHDYENIELVVSSPLTRAILTSMYGFIDKPILIHYHAREFGSMIPENIPRDSRHIIKDLQKLHYMDDITLSKVDFDSLKPDGWPRRHDASPNVIRRDRIQDVLYWLSQRPERCMALVCHYHVIRAALQDPSIKPDNGTILECRLCTETGALTLVTDNEDEAK